MINSNKLMRINGEFSRLNSYSLPVWSGGHYSNLPIFFQRNAFGTIFQDNYALS